MNETLTIQIQKKSSTFIVLPNKCVFSVSSVQGVISATVEEFPLLSLQFFSRLPCIQGPCPQQSAGLVCIPCLTEGTRKQGEKFNPGLGDLTFLSITPCSSPAGWTLLPNSPSPTRAAAVFLLMQLGLTSLRLCQQELPEFTFNEFSLFISQVLSFPF